MSNRYLRAYRAKAIQLVLAWQMEGNVRFRSKWSALLLTAGCVWLLNGLHSAPDNGPANRELMDCVLPYVERHSVSDVFLAHGSEDDRDTIIIDSDDDEDCTAANPYGLVFFHSLRVGPDYPVPRLDSTPRTLSDRSFRYFFKLSFSDVGEEYFRRAPIQLLEPGMRSNNRTRLTRPYIQEDDTPLPELFDVGVQLPPLPRDPGSDIESDGSEQEVEDDSDTALTKLWLQFIRDVTQKCSNKKAGDQNGYCKLPIKVEDDQG